MLRTIYWFIFFWVYLIFTLPNYIRASKLFKEGKIDEKNIVVQKESSRWAYNLVKITSSNVKVIGTENIPKDETVVIVANHQSNFDIPLLLSNIDRKLGFIAKIEIEKLPLIGKWMDLLDCVFIARGNPREALKSINAGVKKIQEGNSIVIFPEGTRSADGKVNEFKAGALKLATKAEVKIVPVVIRNSIGIMKKGSNMIQPADVEIEILPAMDTNKGMNTGDLALELQELIQSKL